MLVIARGKSESLLVDDVVVTVRSIAENSAELVFRKLAGGRSEVKQLRKGEVPDACYESQFSLVVTREDRVRIGVTAPDGVVVVRKEVWDKFSPQND